MTLPNMTTETMDLLARLAEIEHLLTFQEDTVDRLNRVVTEQDDRITRLEALLRQTCEQLESLVPAGPEASNAEVPPHY